MIKARLLKDVKGVEPAEYYINELREIYTSPPVDLEGDFWADLWKNFSYDEMRFTHRLAKAYPTWCACSIADFNNKDIPKEEFSTLRQWVGSESPEFSVFFARLNIDYSSQENIFAGINHIHAKIGTILYVNAFESACYFFLLAKYYFTSEKKHIYNNAMHTAYQSYGYFRGWTEIARTEYARMKRQEISSRGGKTTANRMGAKEIREELVRILKVKIEQGDERYGTKTALSKVVAPLLYEFIQLNIENISTKSRVSSVEELEGRINDWLKRNNESLREIFMLSGQLLT